MLRRAVSLLRRALLALGIALTIWLACSWFVFAELRLPWPPDQTLVFSSAGTVGVMRIDWLLDYPSEPVTLWLELWNPIGAEPHVMALPQVHRTVSSHFGFSDVTVFVPLWLPAFICLAWPVTSFTLARRRHKRGFPVEPKSGGEAVSTPVSSS